MFHHKIGQHILRYVKAHHALGLFFPLDNDIQILEYNDLN